MNWGHKLTLAFIVFISGMGFMVYQAMNTNYELVDKEYYKKELTYQQVIDGKKKADALSAPVQLTLQDSNLLLQMPEEMKSQSVSGNLLLYCAYDQSRDRSFPIQLNQAAQQQIPLVQLGTGRYLAKIEWQVEGESYYTEIPLEI